MSSICLSCSRLSTFSGLLQTLKKWKTLAYISYDPKFQFNCIYLTDQYIVSDILYSEFSIQSLRVSRVQKIRLSQNKQTCLSVYYITLFGTNISYRMEEICRFLVKPLMNNIFKTNDTKYMTCDSWTWPIWFRNVSQSLNSKTTSFSPSFIWLNINLIQQMIWYKTHIF